MEVIIKSSKGNLLVHDEITTLSVILKDDEGVTLPLDKYDIVWYRVKDEQYTNKTCSQTINVSANDISGAAKYEVRIYNKTATLFIDEISDINKNDNVLTTDIALYSSQAEIFKSAEEVDDFPVELNDYTIILATKSLKLLGQIVNVDFTTINPALSLNSADQINFTIYKELDGIVEPLWDKIIDLKLIYVVELNEFFEIKVQIDDTSDKITKTITGTSLCEAELAQKNLNGIEINTEDDIARDDYVVTQFYNPVNPKASFLHRILDGGKVRGYTIGHVDETLYTLQRSFSIDGTDVYSFLTGDCAEQFNCLFQFDSLTRTINVYDLYTNCLNPKCGYRGEFNDICPECGGTNLSYFGEDTTIYVDKDNLTDSITFTTDTDSIKNCFKVVGGDDNVTAAIRAVIPSGSDYIIYIPEEQKEDMSDELVDKYNAYVKACEDAESDYITLNENIYECLDQVLYYTSEMMPTIEQSETKAADEAKKLNTDNLNPLGLSEVTTSTSLATVNAAIKNYAKVYVKTGYFKIEVDTSSEGANDFQYTGTDSQGYSYGSWYGRFIVTNYSDEADVGYSDFLTIKVYDNYGDFLDQKIKKNIAKDDDDDGSIYDVLSIKTQEKFEEAIKLYCLNRLTSFHDAIQGVLDILVETDQASDGADWYKDIYLPYYNKLKACEKEMDARQKTIDDWQDKHDTYVKQRTEIQNKLNMETYLGTDLYNEFCLYRREDTYSNDNFISDGLSNSELLEKAKELVEEAKKELYKSGERQHSISSTLYNLLQMREFAPLVDHFKLGSWIRINVDGTIYRLRLISYEINCGSPQNINVEFSDVTKTSIGYTDIESIKKQTQSLAGGYSYVAKQAKQGEEAQNSISKLLKDGLDASVTSIKSADTEDVLIGKNGIRLRAYDDIYSDYSPKQAAMIHNMLVFTDDAWRTARTALGEIKYELNGQKYSTYGLVSDMMISGKIISGDIYSANYTINKTTIDGKETVIETGTHIDLNDGSFSFADGKIVYNSIGNKLTLDKNILIEYTSKDGTKKLETPIGTVAMNVDTINATYINADNIAANIAKIKFADIEKANIKDAFIDDLESRYIKVGTIVGTDGQFTKLYADALKTGIANIDLATIKDLKVENGFIDSLQTITTDTVTSTVDLALIKKIIVGNATIQDLFTSSFTIGSDGNGTTVMNGSTMQFKDASGNVYIQLGTDAKEGHSLIIRDKNGTALFNSSGVTQNAIGNDLIIDRMVAPKSGSYTGIGSDKLNIDSVEKTLNSNGNLEMHVSKVYFDDKTQTLDTYLAQMKNDFSADLTDKIAQSETYQARIEASNGKVLATANSTTLTCILQKGTDVIDSAGTLFKYSWRRKTATGGIWDGTFAKTGKSITVTYNDISEDYIYYCDVEDTFPMSDVNGNLLTDASGVVLTSYYPIITAEVTIAKSITEVLQTNYYTKQETPSAVTTIIAQTDITKVNGEPNSLLSRVNATKETVDGFENILSSQEYKNFEGLISRVNTTKNTVDGYSKEISETKSTVSDAKAAADNAVSAVNASIAKIEVQYYISTSSSQLAGGSWSTNKPTWTAGSYIWSRTKTTTKSGTENYSEPACITGTQGAKGDPGGKGDTGVGITKVVPEYAMSTSNTVPPTTWSTSEPQYKAGYYIWTRSHIYYDNNTNETSTPVLANAMNSALEKDGVNLLRNSETLIFDDYIVGNLLADASGNCLTDASGYVLVA